MGQIISKGRVSREELGRQMGEQFPAMIIGAKAMNMELGEFERLVESGGLSAEEFIVPFAKQLRATVRETGALQAGLASVRAEIERFKGAMAIQVDQAFAGRFEELTKFIVKEFTVVALKLQPLITFILGAVAGVTVAVTGLVSGFLTVLNPMLTGFNTLIGLAADFIGQLTGGSDSVLAAFELIGGSMALVISLWTGTVVMNALTKILGLWKAIANAAKATFIFSTLASGGTNLAAAALALGAFGATALAVKGYNYKGPSTQGVGTGNISTDKSTNTSIDKIEVNVTAPAGSDANQFGQSIAESMAATMGLSSAITN
jgi:tape measure domain-containing protein